MNLNKIKKSLTAHEVTHVVWNVDGEEFAFNVHESVSTAKAEEFIDIVCKEVTRDSALHFALIEPAIDYATMCIFTDINLTEWDREEVYALASNPMMTKAIDKHANSVYLFNLREAARKNVEYYLELAKPQSNSEKAYEALAELLIKIDDMVDSLSDKFDALDVSDEDVQAVLHAAKRLENVDDDKILEYVMNKEN